MGKYSGRCRALSSAVAFVIFLLSGFSVFSGCASYSDEAQVQIAADVNTFKPFSAPPRKIAYGPYSLKVTNTSAIIAWEERRLESTLRHVEVTVSKLSPATQYFYRVNGAVKDGRFVTAPSMPAPFSFFDWGDSRTGNDMAQQIADRMLSVDPGASFALHNGDMVMNGDDQQSWERDWWVPLADFIRYLPIYPAMGNHEQNSAFYYRYFSSLTGDSCFYSFTWGAVHFVVLCLDDGNSISNEQIEWLKNDLEENRDATFKVVCHHVPPYFSSPADDAGSEQLHTVLVPLYEGIDAPAGPGLCQG